MNRIILFAIVTINCYFTNAQSQTGKISGVVKGTDNKALESATLSLLKVKDSSLVKIAIADKAGAYKFENIHFGNYIVQAEAIGYKKNLSKNLELTATKNALTADEIKLEAAAKVLSDVSVTAKRPLIENKIDKTVVNVDSSPTNTGLTSF